MSFARRAQLGSRPVRRVGDQDAADPADRRRRARRRGDGRASAREIGLGAGERRGAPGSRQPAACGRGADLGVGGRRLAEQQREQLAAAARRSSSSSALRLGVALDRVGGEFVDVGEDRLGEQARAARRRARPAGAAAETWRQATRAPDPVGGLQRVEGPALALLAAAERDVDVAARLRGPPRGRGSARRTGAAPRSTPVRIPRPKPPSSGPRVLGHLAGDRVEDLLGRPPSSSGSISVGDARRKRAPGLGIERFLSSD